MNLSRIWHRTMGLLAWPGILGVALLLLTVGLYIFQVQPKTARLAELKKNIILLASI